MAVAPGGRGRAAAQDVLRRDARPLPRLELELEEDVVLALAGLAGEDKEGVARDSDGEIAAGGRTLALLHPGWKKTGFLTTTKNSPVGFFVFFFGFSGYFRFFNICPKERVFRVFSVSRILIGASRL